MSATEKPSDAMRAQIKQSFIAERGYWRPWTETLLQSNPRFVQHYASYAGYPAKTGPLSLRMVELIYVALDASSTHLFAAGLQTHMQRALECGATHADIFDVLHLVAVQGVASVCQASDILAEALGLTDEGLLPDDLQLRINHVGGGHALRLQQVARLDPGYAEVLLDFVEQGYTGEGLSAPERTLVQLSLHACFTAFNPEAVRQIVLQAKSQALTAAELLQAIQLGAHLAVHGTALGATVFGQIPAAISPSQSQTGDKS